MIKYGHNTVPTKRQLMTIYDRKLYETAEYMLSFPVVTATVIIALGPKEVDRLIKRELRKKKKSGNV